LNAWPVFATMNGFSTTFHHGRLTVPKIVNRCRISNELRPYSPEASYEIEHKHIPQVDHANFITGVRVVFPQGFVEKGDDFIVYYGAADVSVAGARVNKTALIDSLEQAIALGEGGIPL